MSGKETAVEVVLIWAAVYPSVLLFSYAFRWFGVGAPLWVEILVSTALTVPLITFVAQPLIGRAMARLREARRHRQGTAHPGASGGARARRY
ncbi:MAG: hypothetical protein HLUCCA09_02140 [Rhodobacteraceae bacterium HLUCCA09]|nr:MAG: hypothetical protein HLUCCA09_02140 [Rhodobacteraceae bacterium HLUCCA09]